MSSIAEWSSFTSPQPTQDGPATMLQERTSMRCRRMIDGATLPRGDSLTKLVSSSVNSLNRILDSHSRSKVTLEKVAVAAAYSKIRKL
jgi:hypothetical protein